MKPMKKYNAALRNAFRDQYGVVSRDQLRRVGLTDAEIRGRVGRGEWESPFRGVYRSAISQDTVEQRIMAAVVAAGPGAVASHQAAAWLWGLLPRAPDRPSITVSPARRPHLRGVDVHRLDDLDLARISNWRRIPCTDPLRTLVDLAAVSDPAVTLEAVNRGLANRLVSVAAIEAELNRRAVRGRRGVRPLRDLLTRQGIIGAPEASVLERETLALLARAGIDVEGHEVRVGPDGRYRIEFVLRWPVALEVDGYAFHWTPEAMAHDLQRRNELRIDGVVLLVYTFLDVRHHQRRVVKEVAATLGRYAEQSRITLPSLPPAEKWA